jgi:hypothetical protein
VVDPLHLRHSGFTPVTTLPSPVLHSYTTERGPYEEATYWTTSPWRAAADGYSTVTDLARFARARSRGTLLTAKSKRAFFAPDTAGLGPFTTKLFYANSTVNDKGWVYNNPQIGGYTLIVAHHLPTDTSVAIVATTNPGNDASISFATLAFQKLAQLLTPNEVPRLQPCPRGGC